MRRIDIDEIVNRMIEVSQWLGRMMLLPLWILLETIDRVRDWLYDKVTGSRPAYSKELSFEQPMEDPDFDPAQISPGTPSGQTEAGTSLFDWSTLEPVSLLTGLAGCIPAWFASRPWHGLLLWSAPTMMVGLIAMLVFLSNQRDRSAHSRWYLELGFRELAGWQPAALITSNKDSQIQSSRQPSASRTQKMALPEYPISEPSDVESSQKTISDYTQMLFRRAQVLDPQQQSTYIIGAALIQSGSIDTGRRMLRRISPDHAKGFDQGHVMLAASYLEEYLQSHDQQLLPAFEHHAALAARSVGTPVEVLLMASQLHLQAGRQQKGIELLEIAAKRSPTASLRLAALANQLGDRRLQTTSRETARDVLQQRLKSDPANAAVRAELAKLYDGNSKELQHAASLLQEGLRLGESRVLSRALSEVYRVEFIRRMNQSKSQTVDLRVLDASFQADPTNPLVADLMYDLVAKVGVPDTGLETELYRVLTSGVATMATHALLAESHTLKDRDKESRIHLERVHHALPLALKSAWMLTKLNVKEQRLDDAERVATTTLKIVEAQKMLKERYSCELLELLAEIYENTGRIEKAIGSLDRVLTVQPNSISSRQSLVRLHDQVGNEAKAQEQRLEINRIQEETGK